MERIKRTIKVDDVIYDEEMIKSMDAKTLHTFIGFVEKESQLSWIKKVTEIESIQVYIDNLISKINLPFRQM